MAIPHKPVLVAGRMIRSWPIGANFRDRTGCQAQVNLCQSAMIPERPLRSIGVGTSLIDPLWHPRPYKETICH